MQAAFGIAFSAGLPLRSLIVRVGPPNAPNAPSFAGLFVLSDARAAKLQPEVVPTRFQPSEATAVPLHSSPSGASFAASSVPRSSNAAEFATGRRRAT